MINKVKPAVKTANKLKYIKDFSDINEMGDIDEGADPVFSISSDKSKFTFGLSISEDDNCCGLYSLGDFSIHRDSTNIPEKEKIELVKEAFSRLIEKSKNGNGEFTLFLTLIKSKPCSYVKEALKDGSLFTLVKTFKNKNSGNTNDLYVSN